METGDWRDAMQNANLIGTLEEGLAAIPLLDIHTHLDASHLAARGLHDILLYHMVVSDLVSAGCPSRGRLPEQPTDAEAHARLAEAIPYLRHIQNTSIYWGVRIILRDLYGWSEPITTSNWQRLDTLIRERATDKAWPRRASAATIWSRVAGRRFRSVEICCAVLSTRPYGMQPT